MSEYLIHFGVKGQKWGRRNWQNYDGSYTAAGRQHYGIGERRIAGSNQNKNYSVQQRNRDRSLARARGGVKRIKRASQAMARARVGKYVGAVAGSAGGMAVAPAIEKAISVGGTPSGLWRAHYLIDTAMAKVGGTPSGLWRAHSYSYRLGAKTAAAVIGVYGGLAIGRIVGKKVDKLIETNSKGNGSKSYRYGYGKGGVRRIRSQESTRINQTRARDTRAERIGAVVGGVSGTALGGTVIRDAITLGGTAVATILGGSEIKDGASVAGLQVGRRLLDASESNLGYRFITDYIGSTAGEAIGRKVGRSIGMHSKGNGSKSYRRSY